MSGHEMAARASSEADRQKPALTNMAYWRGKAAILMGDTRPCPGGFEDIRQQRSGLLICLWTEATYW